MVSCPAQLQQGNAADSQGNEHGRKEGEEDASQDRAAELRDVVDHGVRPHSCGSLVDVHDDDVEQDVWPNGRARICGRGQDAAARQIHSGRVEEQKREGMAML